MFFSRSIKISLCALVLQSLIGCTSAPFVSSTPQNTARQLVYKGSYQPSLDQKMRRRMLDSQDEGNSGDMSRYKKLIGLSSNVSVTVKRERASTFGSFRDQVMAHEAGQSKELKKDKDQFEDLLLNTSASRNESYTYLTVPLDQKPRYEGLDRRWEILGSAGDQTIAGKRVSLTKAKLYRKIDDYRHSVSYYLLSDELPGRVARYEKTLVDKDSSTPVIKLKLQSIE